MTKDTFWFKHDSNARNDVKIVRLTRQLGVEGYGIYFMLIEILREQVEHRLPLSTIPDIAYQIHASEEKVKAVVLSYELFEIEEEEFFSIRLNRQLHDYNERKTKLIEAGKLGGQASVKHRLSKAKAKLNQPSSTSQPNRIDKIREEEIRMEKIKSAHAPFFEDQFQANQSEPGLDKYKKLFAYLCGDNETKTVYENVLAMKKQISFAEYKKISEKSRECGVSTLDILNAMENKPTSLKGYSNVYLTVNNWMKNEVEKKSSNV